MLPSEDFMNGIYKGKVQVEKKQRDNEDDNAQHGRAYFEAVLSRFQLGGQVHGSVFGELPAIFHGDIKLEGGEGDAGEHKQDNHPEGDFAGGEVPYESLPPVFKAEMIIGVEVFLQQAVVFRQGGNRVERSVFMLQAGIFLIGGVQ